MSTILSLGLIYFFFATQAIFSTLAWHGYYLQAAGVKEFMRDNIDSEMKL